MHDVYKNINDYNTDKENKILIVFDDMIADMIHNKKLNSSDINTKDFATIYRKCTAEPYSFLVDDTTLVSSNPLRFRKNLFRIYNKNHDN